jgi:integrase
MSFIFQNRKNNKNYSIEKQKEYWISLDPVAPGLPSKRYAVGSKPEAEAELLRLERKKIAAKYGIVLNDILVTDILDHYFNHKENKFSNPKHIKHVIEYIKQPYKGIYYCQFNKTMYLNKRQEWRRVKKGYEGQQLAPNTVAGFERFFRAAINFYDPVNSIFKGKRIKYYPCPNKGFRNHPIPDNHLELIIRELQSIPYNKKNSNYILARSLIDFLLILRYTGMRNGALQKIPKKQINLTENVIRIPCSLSKPQSGDYKIPIDGRIYNIIDKRIKRNARIIKWIEIYYKQHNRVLRLELIKKAQDTLFPESIFMASYYSKIDKLFKMVLRKLSLPEYHFHDLRHSAATDWYLKSNDIKKVSLALGHKSINITQHYIQKHRANVSGCFKIVRRKDNSSAA